MKVNNFQFAILLISLVAFTACESGKEQLKIELLTTYKYSEYFFVNEIRITNSLNESVFFQTDRFDSLDVLTLDMYAYNCGGDSGKGETRIEAIGGRCNHASTLGYTYLDSFSVKLTERIIEVPTCLYLL